MSKVDEKALADMKRDMASEAFEMMGSGYESGYYHNLASGFIQIALGYGACKADEQGD